MSVTGSDRFRGLSDRMITAGKIQRRAEIGFATHNSASGFEVSKG